MFKRTSKQKIALPTAAEALPGRVNELPLQNEHYVNHTRLKPPYETTVELTTLYLGLGCFWGAERKFWTQPGVYTTAVGYQAGITPNPTYEEVCTGKTGHAETVMVVYDQKTVSTESLLKVFFEAHDPTQGMRQGNDIGTQYRSGIYCTIDQQTTAAHSLFQEYQAALGEAGFPAITTEIMMAPPFYYAEDYHQQYLAKNPNGYCGIGGTGVVCPV